MNEIYALLIGCIVGVCTALLVQFGFFIFMNENGKLTSENKKTLKINAFVFSGIFIGIAIAKLL